MSLTVIMSWKEWEALPDHDYQRDTAKRIKILAATFQKEGLIKERLWQDLGMVTLWDGSRTKINGHTRTGLVKAGLIEAPNTVEVKKFFAGSDEENQRLYATYDRSSSAKTASDDLYGAFHAVGFTPESGFFRNGKGKTALATAAGFISGRRQSIQNTDTPSLVKEWLDEIRITDRFLHASHNVRSTSGIVVAMLLTLRKHDKAVEDFWKYFVSGNKDMPSNYGPQALRHYMERRMCEKRISGSGNISSMAEVAVTTVERWLRKEKIERITSSSCAKYLHPSWKPRREADMRRRNKEMSESYFDL